MFWTTSARSVRGLKEFLEVYIDKQSVFVIVYFIVEAPGSKLLPFFGVNLLPLLKGIAFECCKIFFFQFEMA
jgi:hypothetical protein